jgi:hypothetical protein
VALGAVACGGHDAVPIDQIAPVKKLVDLNSAEAQGLCDWARGVYNEKLPGARCGGNSVTFDGCMPVPADCPATVAQWKTCVPPRFSVDWQRIRASSSRWPFHQAATQRLSMQRPAVKISDRAAPSATCEKYGEAARAGEPLELGSSPA